MPLYIGDYLADTMHLSTEQHGAYLLLLFHLWRRGTLQDDDIALAKITGLSKSNWNNARPVLAEFFKIHDGLWQHSRVERERLRVATRQESVAQRGKTAAQARWSKHAASNAQALLIDAIPQSEPEPELEKTSSSRHTPFRLILAEYWRAKNHASPEMPWQGRDAKALSDFLAASPNLTETQFREMVGNRARSAVAHGDRVYLWIGNPYTKGGEYDQAINTGLSNVSDAGSNSLTGALQAQALRTGQNSAADAATAEAGAQQNTRDLAGDLAGAQQQRIAGEAGYNQAALGASATPISAYHSLYGTSSNAADGTLGDETQAAKTPSFWDEVGNSAAGNLGKVGGKL